MLRIVGTSINAIKVFVVLLHGGAVWDKPIERLLNSLSLPSRRLRRDGVIKSHEALELGKIEGSVAHLIDWICLCLLFWLIGCVAESLRVFWKTITASLGIAGNI